MHYHFNSVVMSLCLKFPINSNLYNVIITIEEGCNIVNVNNFSTRLHKKSNGRINK